MSDYDKQTILSKIFDISPARDIQICFMYGAQALPQFKKIFRRRPFAVNDYRIHRLYLERSYAIGYKYSDKKKAYDDQWVNFVDNDDYII